MPHADIKSIQVEVESKHITQAGHYMKTFPFKQ